MQRVRAADGTGIAYETAGSGPPLVLLHGITEDRRLWEPVVDRLVPDFTCVLVDARGHGDSDPAVTDYEPLTLAGDIAAVLDAAGVEVAPLLVGHSAGAFQASVYAAAGSGPVQGGQHRPDSADVGFRGAHPPARRRSARGPGFVETITTFGDSLGADRLPPDVLEQLHARRRAARQDMVLGCWRAVFESTDAELMAIVGSQVLPNVKVPYLAIHGAAPGRDYVEWLESRVPTATVEVWDGYGHWLHLVDPDRFATRVRQFVRDVWSRS